MKFKDMPYTRVDVEETKNEFKKYRDRIENSKDGEELANTILEYSKFQKELNTNIGIASVRHTINTKDEYYQKEQDFIDEYSPVFSNLNSEVSKAILASKFVEEVKEKIGEHYLKLLECSLVLEEKAIPYLQKENELMTEYSKLIANSKIEFEGKTYTLTQMAPFLQDVSRERRKAAYEAKWKFFKDNEKTIDELYDQMVKTRDTMAKELGYRDYIDFRYKELCRVDYSRDDVEKYREKILKNITPLAVELRKEQSNDLGIEDFKYYDRPIEFKDGNENPMGNAEFIVENAREMYRELSTETGEFFDFMVENELMDLVAAPGKRGGGYCTSFDKYKSPFIFSNFNGTKGDIDVITHEAGHAFQNYLSQNMEIAEYIWPTYEACEIHSMSMEFLTWPWMELFFKNADKFRYAALKDAISFLPYGVTVDHFQQWVYENPSATPKGRREKYREIENMYQPDLNYDNEFLNEGGYWFSQSHIFTSPLYYIDYTLAQVLAFEYLLKYIEDKESTLEEYITLCKAGGSESFFKLIEIGGLENPMTTDVVERIVPELKKVLVELKKKI